MKDRIIVGNADITSKGFSAEQTISKKAGEDDLAKAEHSAWEVISDMTNRFRVPCTIHKYMCIYTVMVSFQN